MKLSYLFSGQGKQFAEMGQDLYRQEPLYRHTIDEASEILGLQLSDPAVMDAPENTQVAIVAMSTGIYRILEAEIGAPVGAAGLSLGEYSALIAARGIQFEAALPLVRDRSRYMAQAGQHHPGKMAAVLKANPDVVEEACRVGSQAGDIYPANYNTTSQIVIGGSEDGLAAATDYLHEHGIKRVVPLKMSVASHTPFMQEASELLADRIKKVAFHDLKFPVISNTTKQPFKLEEIKQTLTEQLVKPTHFVDCLQLLHKMDSQAMIEIGPGDTLMKFAAKTIPNVTTYHIDSVETLNNVRANVKLVK
ncbi:ACP S-malonyltransferase [Lentilactobacillus raoultii]|uniref:Malonyl CoA-acyl carrier protein transacylase n=1 Tax=Lentilactobacillus raoultii TaxID=1987503 RepID=A0ABW3PCF8_9LACO|nr:ACP S-malonyltransferase [Lentilactobacillus raoultii]